MGGVVLTAIRQSNSWRVKMSWPARHAAKEHPPRYFGRFKSQAEAERWIREHERLTKQQPEPETP
jgi:hypothetical protein